MSETLNLFSEKDLPTPKNSKKRASNNRGSKSRRVNRVDEAKRLIAKFKFSKDNLRNNYEFKCLDQAMQGTIRYLLRIGFSYRDISKEDRKLISGDSFITNKGKDKIKEISQNLAPTGSIYILITAVISIVIMLFLQEDSIKYFTQLGMSSERARVLVYLTEALICLCSISPLKRFRVIAYILVVLNAYTFCINLYKNDEGRVNKTKTIREEKALLIQQQKKYENQIEFYRGNLTIANNQLSELTKKGFITKGNELLGKKISDLKLKIDQSEKLYSKTVIELKNILKKSTSIGNSTEIGIETWVLISMRLVLQCTSVMFLHMSSDFVDKFKLSRLFKGNSQGDTLKKVVNFHKPSVAMS